MTKSSPRRNGRQSAAGGQRHHSWMRWIGRSRGCLKTRSSFRRSISEPVGQCFGGSVGRLSSESLRAVWKSSLESTPGAGRGIGAIAFRCTLNASKPITSETGRVMLRFASASKDPLHVAATRQNRRPGAKRMRSPVPGSTPVRRRGRFFPAALSRSSSTRDRWHRSLFTVRGCVLPASISRPCPSAPR